MRRLALIPLALLLGCWDFEALSIPGNYVPPDMTPPPDIACAKTPNSQIEDCTQNGDVNNNCLYGCDDPTCADHVACFAKRGYMTYGGVNVSGCTGTTKPIYQNLTTPQNCNGSCSCNSTTSCSANLHVYPDQNACNTGMGTGTGQSSMAAITAGNNKCTGLTMTAMNSYYYLDQVTAGGMCTPAMATVNLNPTWGTTASLCDQSASRLQRFSDMKTNGIACLVFDGTDTTVCNYTKPYTKPTVYYTGTTGSSTCTCACAAQGGCTIGKGEVLLEDKAGCNNNPMMSEITTAKTCVQAASGGNNFQAVAVATKIVAPGCNATGSVASTYQQSGGITLCCL